jgi:alpha/beta superfamily hydrolase
MNLVFLHGLESTPHGSKHQALRPIRPGVLAPDTRGVLDWQQRLAIVERELAGLDDLVQAGSSFGGLLAALFADRHPEQVRGYLLCAPTLHKGHADAVALVPERAVVVHAVADDIVPIEASRVFCRRIGIEPVDVEDDHGLHRSTERMVELVRQVVEAERPRRLQ